MKCKNCKKEIPPTGHHHQKLYCSDICRSEYHNSKRKKIKKCLNCGKETTKKYCSVECGTKYRNRRRKIQNIRKTQILEDELGL